jgi:HSP20 family molecular chaperone IbpA
MPFPYGPAGYMIGVPYAIKLVSDIAQARVSAGTAIAGSLVDYVNNIYAMQVPPAFRAGMPAAMAPMGGVPMTTAPVMSAAPINVTQPPKVSFIESDDKYVAYVEMPNADPANIAVKVDGGVVQVYNRAAATPSDLKAVIAIPSGVNVNSIAAEYRSGVLQVTLSKTDQSTRRDVKVAAPKTA